MVTPRPGDHPRAARVWRLTPFGSLPSRIISSVFAAALVTSLAVTSIATSSTESFLRTKIDERFPSLLRDARQRLDLWYARCALDIDTFSRSETVLESSSKAPSRIALDEARKYLSYVREGFPRYRALFVLDPAAATRVWVGPEIPLAPAQLARLAELEQPQVGAVWGAGDERYQVISSPVEVEGRRRGTLHAILVTRSIEPLLAVEQGDASARIYVVGEAGRILARSTGAPGREPYERSVPAPDAVSVVEDYTDPMGEHVVGSAMSFPRLDWTLVVEQSYETAFAPVVAVRRRTLLINTGIVLVFGLFAFLIARSIVRPIRALSDGAHRIALGEIDVEIPVHDGRDEIGVLSRALHAMIARLRSNQIELERKQEEIESANSELTHKNEELRRGNEVLEQLSVTDGLTRLHNHRYFQERLRLEAKRCDRSADPLALLLIDIDDFKKLNDRYGHAVGDDVLRDVARVLHETVRENDLSVRYGGEEFAVLATGTGAEGAEALAEKLRAAISHKRFCAEAIDSADTLSVTVSIGVALYAGDRKRLFNDADRALYSAKGAGKDCVVLADQA